MGYLRNIQFIAVSFFALVLITQTISASNCWIRDESGRTVILHGLNISNASKRTDNQISWHTCTDYERMSRDWGFNCIRMLIFWSAIEPEPGIYNESYLDLVEERVNWAEDFGLYVILDMHQDVYSSKFGGNGAPLWAVWDDNISYKSVEPWWFNYIQPAVIRAFKNFWTEEYLQNHFKDAWTNVADRFSNSSTVIGYEILNEPFFGSFLPWVFEKIYLKNFCLDVINSIRSVDTNHYIFYEPEIMTSAGFRSFLDNLNCEKLVYSPHFYQTTVHEGFPYFGFPFFIKRTLELRNSEAESANVPWLLGEFGVSKDLSGMDNYLTDILKVLNSHLSSWTYWSYDYDSQNEVGIIDNFGGENPQLNYLVYPYPQKIAGDPVSFSYDYEGRVFALEFKSNKSVCGPTEIYIGQSRIYPNGFILDCSDPTSSWEYSENNDKILVVTNSTNNIVKIDIRPSTQELR